MRDTQSSAIKQKRDDMNAKEITGRMRALDERSRGGMGGEGLEPTQGAGLEAFSSETRNSASYPLQILLYIHASFIATTAVVELVVYTTELVSVLS